MKKASKKDTHKIVINPSNPEAIEFEQLNIISGYMKSDMRCRYIITFSSFYHIMENIDFLLCSLIH